MQWNMNPIGVQQGRQHSGFAANASAKLPAPRQAPGPPAFVQSINALPSSGCSSNLQAALTRQPLIAAPSADSEQQRGPRHSPATLLTQMESAVSAIPTSAETARTIVDIVAHGALSTVGADGVPLGTYASYVLDGEGQPILRLRADAVHTANLLAHPGCSLFVQPSEMPARLLARVTLIGVVEAVEGEQRQQAAELHRQLHGKVRLNTMVPPQAVACGACRYQDDTRVLPMCTAGAGFLLHRRRVSQILLHRGSSTCGLKT